MIMTAEEMSGVLCHCSLTLSCGLEIEMEMETADDDRNTVGGDLRSLCI